MKFANVLLLAVSLVFGLYLVELTLWAALDRPHAHPLQIAHPANFVERRDNLEFNYEFKTNSQGLRYEEVPLRKSDGETRFFLVGDSYTEGFGLDTDQRFSTLLENQMSREQGKPVRFINGGLTGTGPLAYWKVMFRIGLKYEPDHILVGLFANDLANMPETVTGGDLETFYYEYYDELPFVRWIAYQAFPRLYVLLSDLAGQTPVEPAADDERQAGFLPAVERYLDQANISQAEFEAWKANIDPNLLEQANLGRLDWPILAYSLLRQRYWYEALDIDTAKAEKQYTAMVFVLDHMVEVAREKGIEISFLYFPIRYQYDPEAFDPSHPWVEAGMVDRRWLTETTELQARLRLWSGDRGVSFHDLTPRFRDEVGRGEALNFKIDGHWNAAGHQVAAKEIRMWLGQQLGYALNGPSAPKGSRQDTLQSIE